MHPNCEAVNHILEAAGLPGRVHMLDEAVTTARAAAQQVGCPVGAIANSLIFETFIAVSVDMREQLREEVAGTPLLIMTSGAHRVDMIKVGTPRGSAAPGFTSLRTRTHRPADRWCGSRRPSEAHPHDHRSRARRLRRTLGCRRHPAGRFPTDL